MQIYRAVQKGGTFKNKLPQAGTLSCLPGQGKPQSACALPGPAGGLFPGAILLKIFLHARWICVRMSDKHQYRYADLKVTYVILCGMLKITYLSAACHLTCAEGK